MNKKFTFLLLVVVAIGLTSCAAKRENCPTLGSSSDFETTQQHV